MYLVHISKHKILDMISTTKQSQDTIAQYLQSACGPLIQENLTLVRLGGSTVAYVGPFARLLNQKGGE